MQLPYPEITSSQNPKVKLLKSLSENKIRKQKGEFIVEGFKEINMALRAGFEMEHIFISQDIPEKYENELEIFIKNVNITPIAIPSQLMKQAIYREKTEGIVAIFRNKHLHLQDVKLSDNPFIIILESVEKPGNLGAIIRTADACNADLVVLCDERADLFNPNVIRSSVGCVFVKQVVTVNPEILLQWLKQKNISLYAAAIDSAKNHFSTNMKEPVAVVFGTEADGLSSFWIKNAKASIKIPMLGVNDSLNVSVSVAVIAYEALRQRNA